MKSKPLPNVPLRHALIYWIPENEIVVLDKRLAQHCKPPEFFSTGACYSWWEHPQTTGKERLLALFTEAMHIMTLFRVDAQKVDKALSVIPEYKRTMARRPF